jgi:hypothetical protein
VVEGFLSKGVHKGGRHKIINNYHKGRKECTQEFPRILEFVARTKLRRDRELEEFKGRTRVEAILPKLSSGVKDTKFLGWESLRV